MAGKTIKKIWGFSPHLFKWFPVRPVPARAVKSNVFRRSLPPDSAIPILKHMRSLRPCGEPAEGTPAPHRSFNLFVTSQRHVPGRLKKCREYAKRSWMMLASPIAHELLVFTPFALDSKWPVLASNSLMPAASSPRIETAKPTPSLPPIHPAWGGMRRPRTQTFRNTAPGLLARQGFKNVGLQA